MLLNNKLDTNPEYEKVEWTWDMLGGFYRITATVRGVVTRRMFRIEDDGRSEYQQIIDNAMLAQKDVIDKFELAFKVKAGLL